MCHWLVELNEVYCGGGIMSPTQEYLHENHLLLNSRVQQFSLHGKACVKLRMHVISGY